MPEAKIIDPNQAPVDPRNVIKVSVMITTTVQVEVTEIMTPEQFGNAAFDKALLSQNCDFHIPFSPQILQTMEAVQKQIRQRKIIG